MEINKQAKALLNGEVIEFKVAAPINITTINMEIFSESNAIQNHQSNYFQQEQYKYKLEFSAQVPIHIDCTKRYYLIEVLNEKS